jgi:hypothetical protein
VLSRRHNYNDVIKRHPFVRLRASWLNHVEIYFSVAQRKVLASKHFHSVDELEARLTNFGTTTSRSLHHSNGSSPSPTLEDLLDCLIAHNNAQLTPAI